MICPYCKKEMKAEKENDGWYAVCKNTLCETAVGRKFNSITQTNNGFLFVVYKGIFKTKKELTRYVNQGGNV